MISIKNLNFNYKDKEIFNNINIEIEKNKITTIMGSNGCGKSTLVKILVGLLECDSNIEINGLTLNKSNIKEIRKIIGVVFENPDNQFVAETVIDDISFTLENMNYDEKDIKKKVLKIADYLNITDILNSSPQFLNNGQKQLVALACALVHDPKILILDEALTYVDNKTKKMIYDVFIDLKKDGLTIINVTHDVEETLFSDNVIVLGNNEVIYNGCKEEFYSLDLKKIQLEYPFIIDISNKLIFYNLIDKLYYDTEELVDVLWK